MKKLILPVLVFVLVFSGNALTAQMIADNSHLVPGIIRTQINSPWYDYPITHVSEITCRNSIVYFLRIEDTTRCVTTRVCADDEPDVTDSFLK